MRSPIYYYVCLCAVHDIFVRFFTINLLQHVVVVATTLHCIGFFILYGRFYVSHLFSKQTRAKYQENTYVIVGQYIKACQGYQR